MSKPVWLTEQDDNIQSSLLDVCDGNSCFTDLFRTGTIMPIVCSIADKNTLSMKHKKCFLRAIVQAHMSANQKEYGIQCFE